MLSIRIEPCSTNFGALSAVYMDCVDVLLRVGNTDLGAAQASAGAPDRLRSGPLDRKRFASAHLPNGFISSIDPNQFSAAASKQAKRLTVAGVEYVDE